MTERPEDPTRRRLLKGELKALLQEYQELLGPSAAEALSGDLRELAPELPWAAALPAAKVIDKPTRAVEELCALFPGMLGRSPKLLELFELLLKVAPTNATILIQGESGTGKELVAHAIHRLSHRRAGPFIAENCAAIPETLLESELFGHTKGAFTGADRTRKGRFQSAHHGTLFLDEVGDMSPGLQKKLLRSLQEGEVRPVGSSTSVKVDVRFLSASNKDLVDLMRRGLFREDLFYRLSPIRLILPALRERGEDVLILAREFLKRTAEKDGIPPPALSADVEQALRRYRWPGNVRELQNEIQRLLALAEPGSPIGVGDLSPEIQKALTA